MTVTVRLCDHCGQRPSNCLCPEGFHADSEITPHPRTVACAECDIPTHEMVYWPVGPDSYSFAPLCLLHRNKKFDETYQSLPNKQFRSALATGLDEVVTDPCAARDIPSACGPCSDSSDGSMVMLEDEICPQCGTNYA